MQYKKLIEEGKLQHDPNQERIALALEKLLGRLEQYEKDMEEYHVKSGCDNLCCAMCWIWCSCYSLTTIIIFHMICILSLLFVGKPSQLGEEKRE